MINILQSLKLMSKKRIVGSHCLIRFMDLSSFVRDKIIDLIMCDSSIWTIKKNEGIPQNRMKEILEEANPVLFNFHLFRSKVPFFRYREKYLSSLIYHIWRIDDKGYKPQQHRLDWLIDRVILPEIIQPTVNETQKTQNKTHQKNIPSP